MKQKLSLFITLLLLFSILSKCNNPEVNINYTLAKSPEVVNVKSHKLKTSSKLLSVSSLVIYKGMIIALNNFGDDQLFHVFDLADGLFLGSIEGYGKGPEEFTRVNSRCFGVTDSSLYVYDMIRRRMVFFTIDQENESVSLRKLRGIDIPDNFDNINGLFYSSKRKSLIGQVYGIYENNKNSHNKEYFEYHASTDSINQFSPYPNFIGREIDTDAKYQVYQKRIVPKPDGSKFAALYSNFSAVKVYDLLSFSLINESLLDSPNPETIDIKKRGEINFKKHYVYYNHTYATDNYFYGLYFGKKIEEMDTMVKKDGGQEIIPEIHVWDWQGHCVARIKPECPISTFAVTKNDEMIYGINPFETDIIHSFNLDQVLK